MVEKATEFGVRAFQPFSAIIVFEVTNVLESVALSAMKQSLQCYCPEIYPIQSLESFVKSDSNLLGLWSTRLSEKSLSALTPSDAKKCAIVGPEGDFKG